MGEIGFPNSETILQSGNVIFESDAKEAQSIEKRLKIEAESRLGISTEFFVRSQCEINKIFVENPYGQQATDDPSHLLVLFARDCPTPEAQKNLQSAILGPEEFHCVGNNIYFIYPDGVGNSKVNTKLIEKHLGVRVTGRNWNTLYRIRSKMPA